MKSTCVSTSQSTVPATWAGVADRSPLAAAGPAPAGSVCPRPRARASARIPTLGGECHPPPIVSIARTRRRPQGVLREKSVPSRPQRAPDAAPRTRRPRRRRPSMSRSGDALEARVRPRPPPDLRRGLPIGDDDVGREVVRAADQRRADAVRVDRDVIGFELGDLLRREPAGRDDPYLLEPVAVERLAHVRDEPSVDTRRLEVPHLPPERAVDKRLRRVEPHSVEPRAE